MRHTIAIILELIGSISYYLGIRYLATFFELVRNHIYTGIVKVSFRTWGEKSMIRYRAIVLHEPYNIAIGNNVIISHNAQLRTNVGKRASEPILTIGDNCCLRDGIHITASEGITIGSSLLTGTNVLITDNAHGNSTFEDMQMPPSKRPVVSMGKVTIGNNVWLGNNVCVLPGVSIGDGVIVGANSVVSHSIPAYCVAAGIPAKILKDLSPS